MTHLTEVSIPLGDRSYDIRIGSGLLVKIGDHLKDLLARKRVFILTDENVHANQFAHLEKGLSLAGIEFELIVLPHGEQIKSFANLESVCATFLQKGIERNDIILAFGGGVIGDLAGFVAAILKRGCRFVQLPTTLLAQVDSSVGGKTAINVWEGKNLIGAFYQPERVLIDISTLQTLPEKQLLAGYAEVVKYGLIGDLEFFEWLEDNADKVLKLEETPLTYAIEKSVKAKAKLVAEDEKEHGARALLNLGHTFGHSLEAEMGYSDALLHGESVSIGTIMAYEYSCKVGLCEEQDLSRVKKHFGSINLMTSLNDIKGFNATAEKLLTHMYKDKKVEGGKLTFILTKAIGEAFIQKDVSSESMLEYLNSKITAEV